MTDCDRWHTAPPPPNTWIWTDYDGDPADDEDSEYLVRTNTQGEPVDPVFGVMDLPERWRYAAPDERPA